MTQHRVAGHFGEFLQGRLGQGGPVALITVPCPDLAVTAHRAAADQTFAIDGQAGLTRQRALALLHELGLPQEGRFLLHTDMPLGGGAGASTASLIALARAAGYAGDDLARACVAVEGASDPLMFENPGQILWAPREGRVLADLSPLPACEIVGGFWGAPQETDPDDMRFPDIRDLVSAWQNARADLAALARLASQSADRTTQIRGPKGDPMPELAHALGALGHVRAHTGSARGLIFAPGAVPVTARDRLRAAGLQDVLHYSLGGVG